MLEREKENVMENINNAVDVVPSAVTDEQFIAAQEVLKRIEDAGGEVLVQTSEDIEAEAPVNVTLN